VLVAPGIYRERIAAPRSDTAGYPHQFYVREVRRMRSAYVVTQKDMAALACNRRTAVQNVDQAMLRSALLDRRQRLDIPARPSAAKPTG
jgi:hypothetical protein